MCSRASATRDKQPITISISNNTLMTEQRNMFIYRTEFYGQQTFRMLPLTESCPFNEVIYDPRAGVLAVISKDKKEKPQMLPKLNDKGQIIPLKTAAEGQAPYVEERRLMDTYYEYYLDNKEDIQHFINMFAANPEHAAVSIIHTPVTTDTTQA